MGRPNKTQALINSYKQKPQKDNVHTGEFILPNNSGDHQKGLKRNTPVNDTDLVNKKYVDDNDCPTHLFIKATAQSEGDLHLSGTDWGLSKTMIYVIRIETSSTDWDLYLLQNDNGYTADDANIPKMQIMENGNGDSNILLSLPYEDEDSSNEVHLYYLDNSGANTADIYILGSSLK